MDSAAGSRLPPPTDSMTICASWRTISSASPANGPSSGKSIRTSTAGCGIKQTLALQLKVKFLEGFGISWQEHPSLPNPVIISLWPAVQIRPLLPVRVFVAVGRSGPRHPFKWTLWYWWMSRPRHKKAVRLINPGKNPLNPRCLSRAACRVATSIETHQTWESVSDSEFFLKFLGARRKFPHWNSPIPAIFP